MEILSFNAGYFLGYRGTIQDYLRNPLKSVSGSRREKDRIEDFRRIIEDIDPEVVLLQEVDGGSSRTSTDGQVSYLSEKLPGYESYSASKYRYDFLSSLPVFSGMSNGILFKKGKVVDHFLATGVKSLVQEVRLDGLSVFSVHLSRFGRRTRKRQASEVSELASGQESLIGGDFNNRGSKEELGPLEDSGFEILIPGETFPSGNPVHQIDFFAYNDDLSVECRVLKEEISDHRPVLATVEGY